MNSDLCSLVIRNGLQHEMRYKQIKPCNLYINKCLINEKAIIEFSAKILGDRYHELISKENIRDCFEKINTTGICRLNIDGIIGNSNLLSADITVDLNNIVMPDILAIKACLRDLNKFQVQTYSNCGFTITKLVKTPSRKIRISIYDKYKEMQKATNEEFLNLLDNKYRMLACFDGKFRIEANVRTVTQLKEVLHTKANGLSESLNSTANPLVELFESVFDLSDETEPIQTEMNLLLSYHKLSDLKDALLVKACNNDISQIDLVLRTTLSPNTNKRKYRAKLARLIRQQPLANQNIIAMRSIKKELEQANENKG